MDATLWCAVVAQLLTFTERSIRFKLDLFVILLRILRKKIKSWRMNICVPYGIYSHAKWWFPKAIQVNVAQFFLASSGRLSTPSLRWMGIYVFRFPLWVLAAGSGLQFALVNKIGRWLLVTTSTLAWWNAALTKFITCGYNSTLAWWNAAYNSTLAWWNAAYNSILAWWNAALTKFITCGYNSTLAWWNAAYNSILAMMMWGFMSSDVGLTY